MANVDTPRLCHAAPYPATLSIYRSLVFVHVLSILVLLLCHGAAFTVTYVLRQERRPERIGVLLDLSLASFDSRRALGRLLLAMAATMVVVTIVLAIGRALYLDRVGNEISVVEVKDGRCTIAGEPDGKLAGSVLTMDRAVRNVTQFAGWSLQNAIRAATLNPAQASGLARHGHITPGAEANLVVLSPAGEVTRTIIRGN